MDLERQGNLMTQIGQAAVRGLPEGWAEVRVEITAMGNGASIGRYVVGDGGERLLDLDDEATMDCLDLRDAMFQEQSGTWYRAVLTIDANMELTADFDYENPPYGDDEAGSEDVQEILMHDHELYPRDNEHLPDWHPAKLA